MNQNLSSARPRVVGLDLVRSLAILFVIAGHFFTLNTPFRDTIFGGGNLIAQSVMIPVFLTGVPLFLMLTGYLNARKTVSRKYYRGCVRVLFAYVLFSVVTILFRKYYLHEDLAWTVWALKVLDFSAIPYAWYIEMWLGIFLLTPFLNLMYQAIPTRRQKHVLLLTLFALTALPDLLNRYGLHLVPGYWTDCYPLLFFFLGSYVREYRPEVPARWLVVAIVALCAVNPVLNLLFVRGHSFVQFAGGPQGVFGVPLALAVFLLTYRLDFRCLAVRGLLLQVSERSLDMYLCCYLFDQLVYPYFMAHHFRSQAQFGPWFFVIVPLLFAGSFLTAWVKDWLCKRLSPML